MDNAGSQAVLIFHATAQAVAEGGLEQQLSTTAWSVGADVVGHSYYTYSVLLRALSLRSQLHSHPSRSSYRTSCA